MVLTASNGPFTRQKDEWRKFIKSHRLENYFFPLEPTVHAETLCGKRKKLESYSGAVSTRNYFCREVLWVYKLHRRTLHPIFRLISPTQLGEPNISMWVKSLSKAPSEDHFPLAWLPQFRVIPWACPSLSWTREGTTALTWMPQLDVCSQGRNSVLSNRTTPSESHQPCQGLAPFQLLRPSSPPFSTVNGHKACCGLGILLVPTECSSAGKDFSKYLTWTIYL